MNKKEFREVLYTVKVLVDQAQEFESQLHDRTYFNYYEQLCEEVFPEYSYHWLTSTSFKLFIWNMVSFVISVDKMSQEPKNNIVNFMGYKKEIAEKPKLRIVS